MRDPIQFAARLPPGFTIGVATAAFQIEGAVAEGGRGPSSWDEFTDRPGAILDDSHARIAVDHYNRYREDVALMRELGIDAYRFSISWPRIQPGGTGPPNAEGIAFYDRLLDELLQAGIRPVATLFHWDTPLELEQRGGWRKRDTARRFADYARIAGEAFGDRVDAWVTLNEPATVALGGYGLDVHAPGLGRTLAVIPVARNLLVAHGLAVEALRAVPVRGRIGLTNVHTAVVASTPSRQDRAYARLFDFLQNRVFADPVLLGRLPDGPRGVGPLGVALRILCRASKRDLATISAPLDFYGLNYYFPSRVGSGPPPAAHASDAITEAVTQAMDSAPFHLQPWPEFEETAFGWPIAPRYLRVVLEQLAARYGQRLPPVVITEGGASFPDEIAPDGSIQDENRIDYLAEHIAVAAEGVEGVDVRGYFIWTLMDNFEWAAGYQQRFGLIHVDFDSLQRTPKASYRWLQEVLRHRG